MRDKEWISSRDYERWMNEKKEHGVLLPGEAAKLRRYETTVSWLKRLPVILFIGFVTYIIIENFTGGW